MTTHARARHLPVHVRAEPETTAGDLRLAGAGFIAIGAAFLTVTMLAASLAPDYDYAGGAISDLGVIPQTALLFNGLLVAIGVVNAGSVYVLYRHGASAWLLGVYLIAGIGAIGAGLLPLDRGDLHSLFALLGFVFFNVEAIVTGGVVRGPMRLLGVAAGLVGLAYVAIMVTGDGGNPAVFGAIGHGGAERLIVYPAMLWLVALGGYLFGTRELERSA
jgi:hypothetical membrane protein